MTLSYRLRNTILAILGAVALVSKNLYTGPYQNLFYSYWGNLSASFSVYFIVRLTFAERLTSSVCAAISLLTVELFECTGGYGFMANIYDPYDYIANALAIAFAVMADIISTKYWGNKVKTQNF